jgi:hypothetical protein
LIYQPQKEIEKAVQTQFTKQDFYSCLAYKDMAKKYGYLLIYLYGQSGI